MKTSVLATALVLALGLSLPATAQLPPGVYAGEHDYKQAVAGHYDLDASHTAVVAKVSHIGYGLSVFRFDKVEGALVWDPATPSTGSLKVSVDTASIATPVPGFAAELAGPTYLKSATYPKASFVSTAFRPTDAYHGQVDGQFTLMGKTKPVTLEVELIGAGKGFGGHPRIGVEAKAQINPQDFGLSPMFGTAVQLVIDGEFVRG